MSLNLFRRLDRFDSRIRQLERTEPAEGGGGGGDHADADHADAFSPLAHTHAVHADSDHDDRFSLLAHTHAGVGAHTHDWADVTGEPATFTPTPQALDWLTDVTISGLTGHKVLTYLGAGDWLPQTPTVEWGNVTSRPTQFEPTPKALDWLTDVATAGQTTNHVLLFNGTTWVPATVPAGAWADITGKPSTFPPTPEVLALGELSDVNTAGANSTHFLAYTGTHWAASAIPATPWTAISGKPSTFPPDEHDTSHDDRFSLLAHTHAVHADSDHDDRFSLLAHVHAVAWGDITGKPSTFTPTPETLALGQLSDVSTTGAASTHFLAYTGSGWSPSAIPATPWLSISGKPATFPPDEHDTSHDDRFSLLAHTHGATATPNVLMLTARATSAVDASFVQWGSDLTIPQPAGTFALDANLAARFTMGAAVTDTRMLIRLDYQTDGSTWVTSANTWSTPIPDVFQSNSATVALYVTGLTASAPVKVRVMSQRQTSTSGTATFEEGVLKVSTW